MPRDSNGNYTLPTGNPVITGSTIASSWANTTLNDIASEITDSLDRSGKGGMLAPFKIQDGTLGLPGLAFASEPSTGIYRVGADHMALVVNGTDIIDLLTNPSGAIYFNEPITNPLNGTALTVLGVSNSGPDVIIQANTTTFMGLRIASSASSGIIQSFVDGNTGHQQWQLRTGIQATGVFDIYDATGSKSLIQIAPTTDLISINTQTDIFGIAATYTLQYFGNATTGSSYGPLFKAGTNNSDFALRVQNQAGSTEYLQVRGDGTVFITDAAASSPATFKAGFRGSPPNVQSGAYTALVSDAGKSVVFTATAAFTLPNSVFAQGDMIVVVAQGGVVTVTQGSGVTLTWANASNTTGNRTLTNIGIATIWWESASAAYITGSGLS